MAKVRLTKTTVDNASAHPDEYVIWDADLPGFGLRVRPSGSKSYMAVYRTRGGRAGSVRKLTIGRVGDHLTPEQARRRAKELLGAAAQGEDPAAEHAQARADISVADLCDLY